jgi:hypothetical protein
MLPSGEKSADASTEHRGEPNPPFQATARNGPRLNGKTFGFAGLFG